MDTIFIDDDFTLNVEEEEEEIDDFTLNLEAKEQEEKDEYEAINKELIWKLEESEFFYNDVNIKEEIDCEDNYVLLNRFRDLKDIKEELEEKLDNEKKIYNYELQTKDEKLSSNLEKPTVEKEMKSGIKRPVISEEAKSTKRLVKRTKVFKTLSRRKNFLKKHYRGFRPYLKSYKQPRCCYRPPPFGNFDLRNQQSRQNETFNNLQIYPAISVLLSQLLYNQVQNSLVSYTSNVPVWANSVGSFNQQNILENVQKLILLVNLLNNLKI